MRHPHGLRAAAGLSKLPNIGDAFEGGFFAGLISHTADGVATHALIVAPRATGASGSGYTLTTNYKWKTTNTTTTDAGSFFDGAANTAAMVTAGIASHPAAQFCVNLSIGGYSDWYLPARFEAEIAYYNLKPATTVNNTSYGINDYSVPKRTANYTSGNPAQTSISAFQDSGAQGFVASKHWTSTDSAPRFAFACNFNDGVNEAFIDNKIENEAVRAFRRIAL